MSAVEKSAAADPDQMKLTCLSHFSALVCVSGRRILTGVTAELYCALERYDLAAAQNRS